MVLAYAWILKERFVKKISKVFVTFSLCIGLSLQGSSLEHNREIRQIIPAEYNEGIGHMLTGLVEELVSELGPRITGYVREQLGENALLRERFEKIKTEMEANSGYFSFVKSEFPEEIEQRIDAIINQKYQYQRREVIYNNARVPLKYDLEENDEPIEIFPTPKSKIFVLQNIQDFFDFERSNTFKSFNSKVYEICTKKINELEKNLAMVKDVESHIVPGVFEDKNKFNRSIDEARDDYMKQLNISVPIIAKMSSVEIEKKINEVREIMIEVATQEANNGSDRIKVNDISKNPKFRALISISTYLYYKFTTKAPILPFRYHRKQKELEKSQEEEREAWKKDEKIQGPKKIGNITHVSDDDAKKNKKMVAELYAMKLLSSKKAIAQREAETKEWAQKSAQYGKPAPQSFWSKIKSWFGY